MPLTILIPVSAADISRLESTISVMEFLGGLQKHSVLFACAPSVQAQVTEAAAKLRSICLQTSVEALPREPEPLRRFGAFNMIFRDSVELLYKRGNVNPWIWWELDMVPIKAGYADRLELEYHQKGQPFMGVRRKGSDTIRGLNGEIIDERDPRVQGDYMVAVGIYPPNFKDFSVMYKYPDPSGNMPTDVVIRHEVNRHLHNTQLIAHHYKTGNYRRENGKIVCDDFQHVTGWPSYAGEISDMAVVVHGDKSGTLAELILREAPSNVSPSGIVPSQASAENPDLASLRSQNEEMRRDIAAMQEQWRVKENGYAEEIEKLKEKLEAKGGISDTSELTKAVQTMRKAAVESEIVEKPVPSIELVRKALLDARKSVQLGVLAADFGCNKKALRVLLESDPKIKIAKGGLAWVSLAA